jgi:hypothetical protein
MTPAIAKLKQAAPKTMANGTAETPAASILAYGPARATVSGAPLSPEELELIDAYWRASLYLCLGMLYLQDNPLLRKPLKVEHIKPRMLGHWGSAPGSDDPLAWTGTAPSVGVAGGTLEPSASGPE